MKAGYKIVTLTMAAMSVVSCGKNRQIEVNDPQLLLQASTLPLTRYAGDAGFDTGDEVGVYVVKKSASGSNELQNTGNYADNRKFINEFSESSGSLLKPEAGKEVYLMEGDTYDIYSYFPYSAGVSSVTEVPFSVKTDQSAAANFLASDFLWAKTADVKYKLSPVKVEYKHLFSQITLSLTAGEGYTNEDIVRLLQGVTVKDVVTDVKVDITRGVAVAGTQVGNIVPNRKTAGQNIFRVMLVPQTVTDAKPLIDIQMGDKHYPVALNLDLKAGTSYQMNINIDKDFAKTVITLNGVVSWNNETLPDYDITVSDPSGDNIKKYCDVATNGERSSAYLEGATIASFECGSGAATGYLDYAHDMGVTAKVANGEDIIVKFKNVDLPADTKYKVYVFADWNNDGDFEDANELLDMSETMASVPGRVQTLPFTIDIPAGSVSPTTVRIIGGLSDGTDIVNGCGTANAGNVYDVAVEF